MTQRASPLDQVLWNFSDKLQSNFLSFYASHGNVKLVHSHSGQLQLHTNIKSYLTDLAINDSLLEAAIGLVRDLDQMIGIVGSLTICMQVQYLTSF